MFGRRLYGAAVFTIRGLATDGAAGLLTAVSAVRTPASSGRQPASISRQGLGRGTINGNAIWNRDGGWYFSDLKTESRRCIPLPASLLRDPEAHRRRWAEAPRRADYEDHDLVFPSQRGTPVQALNLPRRHFKPLLEKAGIPKSIRLYDLRHSCATILLAAGENPKVIAERLGHSSIQITLDTYCHVLPGMQQQASDRMEKLLIGRTQTH